MPTRGGYRLPVFDPHTDRIIPSLRHARVHLFRHGEVETGNVRVCRGQIDVALSARGEADSAAVAVRHLRAWGPPDRVITSDLRRCDYFARQFGCVVESEPRLREQDMGEWEGKSWAELTERDPAGVTAYWDDYARARPTGGESWGEAAARVASWWDAIREPTGHIVVITHIGPIRALLCHWLGLPPTEALRFAPVCASETRVLHADAGVVIEAMGLPP